MLVAHVSAVPSAAIFNATVATEFINAGTDTAFRISDVQLATRARNSVHSLTSFTGLRHCWIVLVGLKIGLTPWRLSNLPIHSEANILLKHRLRRVGLAVLDRTARLTSPTEYPFACSACSRYRGSQILSARSTKDFLLYVYTGYL